MEQRSLPDVSIARPEPLWRWLGLRAGPPAAMLALLLSIKFIEAHAWGLLLGVLLALVVMAVIAVLGIPLMARARARRQQALLSESPPGTLYATHATQLGADGAPGARLGSKRLRPGVLRLDREGVWFTPPAGRPPAEQTPPGQPEDDQPRKSQPTDEQPRKGQATDGRPSGGRADEQPPAGHPAEGEPAADQHAADQHAVDQPAVDQPVRLYAWDELSRVRVAAQSPLTATLRITTTAGEEARWTCPGPGMLVAALDLLAAERPGGPRPTTPKPAPPRPATPPSATPNATTPRPATTKPATTRPATPPPDTPRPADARSASSQAVRRPRAKP